jgi:hypothetical protein
VGAGVAAAILLKPNEEPTTPTTGTLVISIPDHP